MKYLQEYDLYIRPKNIVEGQGICKLAIESTKYKEGEDELYEDWVLLEK